MQEATESAIAEEEVQYVPDVKCPNPNCGRDIRLSNTTYAWYEGPVPCEFCHCTMHLRIGDTDLNTGAWGPGKKTERFGDSRGGNLLYPPTLIREADSIPTMMLDGIGTNVPLPIREAFDTATHHFNRLDYIDAAVRCRFTLEVALMDRGISRDRLPVMADQARSQALVTELVKNLCVVVAGLGGDAAHPQTNPARYVDRNEALLAIDTTANVLRGLYPSTGSD